MADKAQPEFDKLLNSLLERKPPGTSASKIKELTKIAMSSPKVGLYYDVNKLSGNKQSRCLSTLGLT